MDPLKVEDSPGGERHAPYAQVWCPAWPAAEQDREVIRSPEDVRRHLDDEILLCPADMGSTVAHLSVHSRYEGLEDLEDQVVVDIETTNADPEEFRGTVGLLFVLVDDSDVVLENADLAEKGEE